MEIRGGNYFQAALMRKALGAGRGEQNMPAVLHHLARGDDRVVDAAHGGHPSGAQRRSVHDAGVELDFPVGVRRGAASGIENARILQRCDRRGHRVEARAAVLQDVVAGLQGTLERRALRLRAGAPDLSRAAVDGHRAARLHCFFAWPSAEQGWSLEQRSPITPTAWISISMPGRAKLLTVISALPGSLPLWNMSLRISTKRSP